MRIIKEGKLPEERSYNKECPICHTIFSFQQKEAVFIPDMHYDKTTLKIKCPYCNRDCYLNYPD